MRWVVLLLVAACYSPRDYCKQPGDLCSNVPDDADAAIDDSADAQIDAGPPQPLCTPSTTTPSENFVTPGEWLVVRSEDEKYTLKFRVEDDGSGTGGVIGRVFGARTGTPTPGTTFSQIFEDPMVPGMAYASPHLAPNGIELFMRLRVNGTERIGRSTRTVATDMWEVPAPIDIKDGAGGIVPIGFDYDPSSPTTTAARRMVISKGDMGGFIEVEEVNATEWKIVRTQTFKSYMLFDNVTVVDFLGQAHLNPDGRRIVFRGRIGGAIIAAFYMDRATINDDFVDGVHEIVTVTSAHTPFFTADCKTLYISQTENTIIATYP